MDPGARIRSSTVGKQPNRSVTLPAWAGILGPVLFTAGFLAQEAFRRDGYDPLAEPVSALEAGPNGWVQQTNGGFTSAANDTPEQLYALWDGAVERSRPRLDAAIADGGLDQLVHVSDADGHHASLRRLLCDLIEEYGRHTGHADLLREAVDGRVGDDPPEGWRPRAGRPPWKS